MFFSGKYSVAPLLFGAAAVGLIATSVVVKALDDALRPIVIPFNKASCTAKIDRDGVVQSASIKDGDGNLLYKFRPSANLLDAPNEGVAGVPRPAAGDKVRYEEAGRFTVSEDGCLIQNGKQPEIFYLASLSPAK